MPRLLLLAALALAACNPYEFNKPVGSEIDEGGFGNATMNNELLMTGKIDATPAAKLADEISVVRSVHTNAINHDPACTFVMTAQAYRDPAARRVTVEAGRTETLRLDLRDSGRWYDYTLRTEGDKAVERAFLRRFAGRVENGEASFSDPAMGAVNAH